LLADVPGRGKILKGRIDKLRHRFDHILIDNPPSLNLLTINALIASDNYVIIVSPSFLSLVGLQSLLVRDGRCHQEEHAFESGTAGHIADHG
jgi:chromosome partitioning protein